MPGGVFEIAGVIAMLALACEVLSRIFPRRLIDEMQEIAGDRPGPRSEPEVDALRKAAGL